MPGESGGRPGWRTCKAWQPGCGCRFCRCSYQAQPPPSHCGGLINSTDVNIDAANARAYKSGQSNSWRCSLAHGIRSPVRRPTPHPASRLACELSKLWPADRQPHSGRASRRQPLRLLRSLSHGSLRSRLVALRFFAAEDCARANPAPVPTWFIAGGVLSESLRLPTTFRKPRKSAPGKSASPQTGPGLKPLVWAARYRGLKPAANPGRADARFPLIAMRPR
jgi:hypothetical protein